METESQPLVSVIVTTYNREELLKETLTSILNQTYKNFELIVIDNFSNYDFFAFIGSFNDKRIRSWQNQNNGVIAVNRNTGIKNARGKFIAFCDDDDIWKPEKIETQLIYFKDGIIAGIGSNAIIIGSHAGKIMKHIKEDLVLSDQIFYQSVPLSSLMIRNTGILFDENPLFKAVEDADLQLHLLCNNTNRILMLKDPLIFYRIHNLNESSPVQNKANFLNVLEKYKPVMAPSAYTSKYAHFHYCLGYSALKQNKKGAREFLKRAIKSKQYKFKFLTLILMLLSLLPPAMVSALLKAHYGLKHIK